MSKLSKQLSEFFPDAEVKNAFDETTLVIKVENIFSTLETLKNEFNFDVLCDVTGVDYLHYGKTEWDSNVSSSGFSRSKTSIDSTKEDNRYCVVYHLLSIKNNKRLRVKSFLNRDLQLDSVINIWDSANWFEREVFDLFGFLFKGHPDLRRILTDYGFIGHPLRKDFPMVGEVQMRYDENQQRVVYEPVDIELAVNVPKVIK
ncbi:NADH-ubiquinone oxidoreductase chain C [hydrothermal vent metagenome]|uniref:NADH-ubiquinone oxidoreductase chain C n=1 Tax=hydrothermal vent metagenome TaxID=652676 RepID=A0A1W1CC72_9ZZZZ